MKIIKQGQTNFQEPVSNLALLPRLDRLDRVLQLLEERHSLAKRLSTDFSKKVESEDEQYSRNPGHEDPRKSLSSILEEVHFKGTLIERLSMLENRVVQLSLNVDEGTTSGSSSSTNVPVSNKLGNDAVWSTITTESDVNKIASPQELQYSRDDKEAATKEESSVTKQTNVTGQGVKKREKKGYRKMFGWFSMGC